MEKKQEVIMEWNVTEQDGKVFKAERGFYLKVKLIGPLTEIPKGALVRLSEQTAAELFFSNKVEPIDLPTIFEVVREFDTEQAGEWISLSVGDIIRLNREEALPLLKELKIRQRKGIENEIKSA